jgi:hypothetical protein
MLSFAPQLICANTTSAQLPEVNMIRKRKTLQWKNTKNYYEVKLAESSMFAF